MSAYTQTTPKNSLFSIVHMGSHKVIRKNLTLKQANCWKSQRQYKILLSSFSGMTESPS